MDVLADLLAPGLRVVFCGTAVATASAARGHYYAGSNNRFWTLLHRAGFTPMLLRPEEDVKLLALGLGITDLVKHVARSHDRQQRSQYALDGRGQVGLVVSTSCLGH